jgi:MFS transporter, FHS family, L-fucose permease
MKKESIVQLPDGYLNRTPIFQYIMLSMLFPMWAVAASLNDILITQFKSIFELSNFASAFVQSAFYGGYFLVAIPASMVIKKTNYKIGIMTGLIFYIIGCSLFFPASHMATYTMFLVALFAIAVGLGFLETSANTYSSMIGPKKYSTLRLNISQTFYPVGSIAGILMGKYLVFQEGKSLKAQMANMTPEQARVFGEQMLQHTLEPYKYIIFVLIGMLILFLLTKFPACKTVTHKSSTSENPSVLETLKYLSKIKNYRKGILAQFLYVGIQTAVWSYTIRLALELNPHINERFASNFMIFSFIGFFVGKFVANLLIARFSTSKVLTAYSMVGSILLVYVAFVPNMTSVYAAILVSAFFGPCWASIYAKTLEFVEDKRHTETAGAILVMSIVGGAVIPVIQGLVSDLTGSMQLSFLVSMACFVYIGTYFYKEMKKESVVKQEEKTLKAM